MTTWALALYVRAVGCARFVCADAYQMSVRGREAKEANGTHTHIHDTHSMRFLARHRLRLGEPEGFRSWMQSVRVCDAGGLHLSPSGSRAVRSDGMAVTVARPA